MSNGESESWPTDAKRSGAGDTVIPSATLSRRYELLGRLGTGGMAEVHLARAVGIDDFEKIVVLKRVLGSKREDARFVAMLRDEARVAATLEHPNIVSTHDIGVDDDEYFFTMEYLHGEDVKAILTAAKKAEAPLPLELAMQIAISCAAGLHHAHEQTDYSGHPLNIVHRDVSPSNIIVTRQSGVKLIDFGIAKAASDKEVTAVGMVKGKTSYMSPEQCRGEKVDHRSDIFSLGIVLYEMVTMTRPFVADNPLATLHKILTDEVQPPRTIRDECPSEIERIIMRALQKDPGARYQTTFAMQEELELATRDCGLLALPGALGRYLEHLFGPKPHPWTSKSPAPPPVPRWAWKDLDLTVTSRQAVTRSSVPSADAPSVVAAGAMQTPAEDLPPIPDFTGTQKSMAVTQKAAAIRAEDLDFPPDPVPPRRTTATIAAALAGSLLTAGAFVLAMSGDATPPPAAAAQPTTSIGNDRGQADPSTPARTDPTAGAPTNAVEPTLAAPTTAHGPETTPAPGNPIEDPPPSTREASTKKPSREERRREANRLLEQAKRFSVSDPVKAFDLARKSLRQYPTPDGHRILGLSACKLGHKAPAKRAYKRLKGSLRSDLASVCMRNGIDLEL